MARPREDLKPVYLIISDQPMLIDQAVRLLRERVSETANLDFDIGNFDGENANSDDIIAAANTLPFMGEHRLVLLRNVDKMSKDDIDALTEYAADPSPTTVLGMTAQKMAKNTRLYKAVDKLGGVLERTLPKGKELVSVVRGLFGDRGRTLDYEGAELLLQHVGKDLQRMTVERDKLIAYAGERTALTRADVEEVVAATAETSVFEFIDALGDRDCVRALTLLDGLLREGGSTVLSVHYMALRQIRDLITASSLRERGQSSVDDLARTLGRPDWQVKRLPRQAGNFLAGELVELLGAAAQAEQEMKTSREDRLALERWVVKVCGR